MKTLKIKQILIVLITLSFCILTYAEQAEPYKRNLKLLTSDEYDTMDSVFTQYMEEPVPTHIAIVEFDDEIRIPRNMQFQSLRGNDNSQVKGKNGWVLSYGIINDQNGSQLKVLNFMCFINRATNSKIDTIVFLADSSQHAKEIVQAYIKGIDDETTYRLSNLIDNLETYQEILKDGDTVIPRMEDEYKELEEQKRNLFMEYAKANYLDEKIIPDINEITQVKGELARSLRESDFELVGLDAKIDSINKYKLSGTIIDNETLIKLNQILITSDIERAGIFARKQAFETSLKLTTQLYNIIKSSETKSKEMKHYKAQFNQAPQRISEYKMRLKNPSFDTQYAEIENNTVIIKPVKFE